RSRCGCLACRPGRRAREGSACAAGSSSAPPWPPGRSPRPRPAAIEMSRLQLSAEVLDPGPQILQLLLRLVQQLERQPVGADQLLQRRIRVRKAGDRPLQAVQNVGRLRAHAMAEATRPRMPFTNLPASSPAKVLASSIDSLIAAFGGTCLSMVSS